MGSGLQLHPGRRWQRYRSRFRPVRSPLPALALLNLALLLTLFLVWNSGVVLQPGLIVRLPVAAFVSGTPYGAMAVTVTQEGQIFFNDERTPLDRLGEALVKAARERGMSSLTVEADAQVPYETIVRIVNLASLAGIRQVNLATRPSFGEEVMP